MYRNIILCLIFGFVQLFPQASFAQTARTDLYQCEGCEGALERQVSDLDWQTRIGPTDEPGEPMILRGTVFQTDGTSPAEGVVIYAYQTTASGLYAGGTRESVWSRRHGRMRGWIVTNADGQYKFATVKPGPYPGRELAAHIHFTILEHGKPPYWIDDIVFEGEVFVDDAYRGARENRGGDGIVTLSKQGDTWVAERDIILEPHPEKLESPN